jgi:hypothetical protein
MKIFYILSFLAGLACVGSTQAQPHTLSPYLSMNRSGIYPLSLVWSGVQRITLQTGYYKYGGRGAMTVPEEDLLRFDRYQTQLGSRFFGRQVLDDSTATNLMKKIYGYKAELPSDSEFSKAQDVSSLTNILKLDFNTFRIYPTNANVDDTQGFHFYTLGSNNTIRVMEVVVHRMASDTNILGIIVKRGTLYPTKLR